MASTYTWANALTVIAPYIKSIPTTVVDAVVCDQINSFIWKAYPWRWAQFSLTSAVSALDLVDGTQDYSIGTTTGGGFYQLLRTRITRTDTTPDTIREKEIVHWLPPNLEQKGGIDTITSIAYEPVSGGLRLNCAASVPSGVTMRIDGEYWFQPVKITLTSSTIVFPDQYFDVAVEGLKWRYYQLGDDRRQADQRQVFTSLLSQMIKDEDYGDAPMTRFPSDPIGVSGMSHPGIYGY